MMSAWTKGPDRGLSGSPVKDMSQADDPEAVFHPTLSNPALREKVKSSEYGSKIPRVKPTPISVDPEATFEPTLPSDPTIRAKARSSSYGSMIPSPKRLPTPETPTFKPEIADTPESAQIRARAKSAGYGKAIPAKPQRPEPKVDPKSFRPNLGDCPFRAKAPSSGYTTDSYTPVRVERPKTAPPSSTGDSASSPYVSRYTLYRDKSDKGDKETPRAKSPVFILDGVQVAKTEVELVRMRIQNTKPIDLLPRPEVSDVSKTLKEKAQSQGYNSSSYSPAYNPDARRKSAPLPKRMSFSKKSPLDEQVQLSSSQEFASFNLANTPEAAAFKRKVSENAKPQGYSRNWTPPKTERPTPTETKPKRIALPKQSPLDTPTVTSSIEEFASFGLPSYRDAETFREKVKENAKPQGYSRDWTPPKGAKVQKSPQKSLVVGKKSTLKTLNELEPAPRSAKHSNVKPKVDTSRPLSASLTF